MEEVDGVECIQEAVSARNHGHRIESAVQSFAEKQSENGNNFYISNRESNHDDIIPFRLPKHEANELSFLVKSLVKNWADEVVSDEDSAGGALYYWDIMSDKAMDQIGIYAPLTLDELRRIPEMTEETTAEYGVRVLLVVQSFLENKYGSNATRKSGPKSKIPTHEEAEEPTTFLQMIVKYWKEQEKVQEPVETTSFDGSLDDSLILPELFETDSLDDSDDSSFIPSDQVLQQIAVHSSPMTLPYLQNLSLVSDPTLSEYGGGM